MTKSASIKNLAAALLVFHVKMGKISKDAKNPFFKSKYASLSNILDQIATPLEESHLAISQFPDSNHGLTTILIHTESGEFIESTYDMSPVPEYAKEKDSNGAIVWRSDAYNSPQSVGSAITYARRYALGAVLQLNIDDDDDGNAASGQNEGKPNPAPEPEGLPWLNENTEAFKGAVEKMKAGKSSVEAVKKFFRISKATEAKLIELSKKK